MTTETKLPLGSVAWLRSQADQQEELLHALGSIDDECERETKREILGLRDAATRMEALEAVAATLEQFVSDGYIVIPQTLETLRAL